MNLPKVLQNFRKLSTFQKRDTGTRGDPGPSRVPLWSCRSELSTRLKTRPTCVTSVGMFPLYTVAVLNWDYGAPYYNPTAASIKGKRPKMVVSCFEILTLRPEILDYVPATLGHRRSRQPSTFTTRFHTIHTRFRPASQSKRITQSKLRNHDNEAWIWLFARLIYKAMKQAAWLQGGSLSNRRMPLKRHH